jgi:hypothetical protein
MMMMTMNFWSILTLLLATIVVGGLAHEIDVKNKGMFEDAHSLHPRICDKALRQGCKREREIVTGVFFLICCGISLGIQGRWKSRL